MTIMTNGKEKTMALRGFRRTPFGTGSTYTCRLCKKLTRNVGGDEAGCDLCLACYTACGLENEHNDYGHPTPVDGCPECPETKRAVSPAVNTPRKGKETTMATKNTGNAAKAQSEIDKLVKRLLALKDKSDGEGRKIRRMLRKLGHKGGVRGRKPGRKPSA